MTESELSRRADAARGYKEQRDVLQSELDAARAPSPIESASSRQREQSTPAPNSYAVLPDASSQ